MLKLSYLKQVFFSTTAGFITVFLIFVMTFNTYLIHQKSKKLNSDLAHFSKEEVITDSELINLKNVVVQFKSNYYENILYGQVLSAILISIFLFRMNYSSKTKKIKLDGKQKLIQTLKSKNSHLLKENNRINEQVFQVSLMIDDSNYISVLLKDDEIIHFNKKFDSTFNGKYGTSWEMFRKSQLIDVSKQSVIPNAIMAKGGNEIYSYKSHLKFVNGITYRVINLIPLESYYKEAIQGDQINVLPQMLENGEYDLVEKIDNIIRPLNQKYGQIFNLRNKTPLLITNSESSLCEGITILFYGISKFIELKTDKRREVLISLDKNNNGELGLSCKIASLRLDSETLNQDIGANISLEDYLSRSEKYLSQANVKVDLITRSSNGVSSTIFCLKITNKTRSFLNHKSDDIV